MKNIVVVGASLAGHGAAKALRDLGYDGRLTVVGAEPHRPYDRYPLSKAFLTGGTHRQGLDIGGAPAETTWRLGETATRLDLAGRYVVVNDRTRIPFDGLVVASGARPRDVESVAGVRGAFVLRTVDDAGGLRAALDSRARRVVVVGGGLIGAEVAAAAVAGGHDTTLVDASDIPTRRAVGLPIAEHLLHLHRAAGVRLRLRTRMRRLHVRAGGVAGVVLDDGMWLPAEVVVMATGTLPNVEWLRGSGLSISAGLACRPTLHALGDDRVVGAGDVVNVPHPLLDGESLRVEHWASTLEQAAVAAASLVAGLDAGRPLTALPTFGTTIHRARIRSVGFPQVADRSRVVWGSVESGQALVALGPRGQAGRRAVAECPRAARSAGGYAASRRPVRRSRTGRSSSLSGHMASGVGAASQLARRHSWHSPVALPRRPPDRDERQVGVLVPAACWRRALSVDPQRGVWDDGPCPHPSCASVMWTVRPWSHGSVAGDPGQSRRPARIMVAVGADTSGAAQAVGVSRPTVIRWRDRFAYHGLAGLDDEPRPGRPKRIDDSAIAATLDPPPDRLAVTTWSSRLLLATHPCIGDATVARAWRRYHVQPWRRETSTFSTDPQLDAKGPRRGRALPEPGEANRAVRRREIPQIQALSRTRADRADAAWLPEKATHDGRRDGTTKLFVALEVTTNEGNRPVLRPARQGRVPRHFCAPGRSVSGG